MGSLCNMVVCQQIPIRRLNGTQVFPGERVIYSLIPNDPNFTTFKKSLNLEHILQVMMVKSKKYNSLLLPIGEGGRGDVFAGMFLRD